LDKCKLYDHWADHVRNSRWKDVNPEKGNGQCGDNAVLFEEKPPSIFHRAKVRVLETEIVKEKKEFNFDTNEVRKMYIWME